jgi:hypothetical protein
MKSDIISSGWIPSEPTIPDFTTEPLITVVARRNKTEMTGRFL